MPGAALCIANLKIKKNRITKKAQKITLDWCNDTLGKSQALCPVKTGKLRRSGNVKIEKNTFTEFYCRISYPVKYAASVHEKPIPHRVGQSQFLRIPFNHGAPRLIKTLENELKREI